MEYYLFNINDLNPEDAEKCLWQMSEQRKNYISSVSNSKRKNESIAGEWFLKKVVGELYGIPWHQIIIERTPKGKPYIKDMDIYVSVSHSGDFVAVAVDSSPIGIDIEVIKPINLRVANKACNESDMQFLLTGKTENEKLINLLKIWTAKEAYFKMTGTGIVDIKKISYKEIKARHFIDNNLIITLVN